MILNVVITSYAKCWHFLCSIDLLGVIPAPNNGTKGSLYDVMVTPPVLHEDTTHTKIESCDSQRLAPKVNFKVRSHEYEETSRKDVYTLYYLHTRTMMGYSNVSQNCYILQDIVEDWNDEERFAIALGAMVIRNGSKICNLPQANHVTAFDNTIKLPILVSMIIDNPSAYVSMM